MIDKLYTVYRSELLRYCYTICGNISDAEDLLQETFARALANLDILEELGENQQRSWLYKVARNIFYDHCRRENLRRNILDLLSEQTEEEDISAPETALLLAKLPPELFAVFVKRYFLGYTSKEIAQEYGLSPSGIRAMLSRARKALKELLKD